jgi:thioredoxin reductase
VSDYDLAVIGGGPAGERGAAQAAYFAFEDAGEHGSKGVPDRWHLYRVVG